MNSPPDTRDSSVSPTPVIRVVDDDLSFSTAVTRLLRAAKYEVRGYASAAEFLDADPCTEPGCILLDLRMPRVSGLDLQQALARLEARLPIIFLTGHGDIPASVRAMKAGAVDFLTKPVQEGPLFEALQKALEKDALERRQRRELAEIADRAENLTPREYQVFSLVITGMLNKQIADRLTTTEKTIKVHRGRVMAKMNAASLADLVRMAGRLGLPSHPPDPSPS
jgi:FixJ family two-component response regulator